MHGQNPKRPPIKVHDGLMLDVVDIFPTIQGEGPFAGHPATFIRLGGCNLACDFCDTEFEDYEPMAVEAVVERIKNASPFGRGKISLAPSALRKSGEGLVPYDGCPHPDPLPEGEGVLIVITGGEPMRQNLLPLCEALLAQGFDIQIETNGTLYQQLPDGVHIVCSPKNTGAGYQPLRPDVLGQVDALKFIISKTHPDYRQVPEWCLAPNMPPIYVQPMDEYDPVKNKANQQYAAELAMQHGYRLSMQLHKILGIA